MEAEGLVGLADVLRKACSAAVVPIALLGCAVALLFSGMTDSFLAELGRTDSAEDLLRGVPEVLLRACSAAVVPKAAGALSSCVAWDCSALLGMPVPLPSPVPLLVPVPLPNPVPLAMPLPLLSPVLVPEPTPVPVNVPVPAA